MPEDKWLVSVSADVCACVAGVKHFPGNSARDRAELAKIPPLGEGDTTSWAASIRHAPALKPASGNANPAMPLQ